MLGKRHDLLQGVTLSSLIAYTCFDDDGAPYYLFPRYGVNHKIKFTDPDTAMQYWRWHVEWQNAQELQRQVAR